MDCESLLEEINFVAAHWTEMTLENSRKVVIVRNEDIMKVK